MGNKESSKQADRDSIKAAGSLRPKNHEKELTVGRSQKKEEIPVPPLKSLQHSCKLEEDEDVGVLPVTEIANEDNGSLSDDNSPTPLRSLAEKKPLIRAKKEHSTLSESITTSGNIAAIDFGTTGLSLAYITKNDYSNKANVMKMDEHSQSVRILNAVLLKLNGSSCEVCEVGNAATKKFKTSKPADVSKYIYFEQIKMLLKREEVGSIY